MFFVINYISPTPNFWVLSFIGSQEKFSSNAYCVPLYSTLTSFFWCGKPIYITIYQRSQAEGCRWTPSSQWTKAFIMPRKTIWCKKQPWGAYSSHWPPAYSWWGGLAARPKNPSPLSAFQASAVSASPRKVLDGGDGWMARYKDYRLYRGRHLVRAPVRLSGKLSFRETGHRLLQKSKAHMISH